MQSLLIPITKTARKYGYIIWPKKNDEKIRELFNNNREVTLIIGNKTIKNRIDYKKRRIGITYTISRSINVNIKHYEIVKKTAKKFLLNFK